MNSQLTEESSTNADTSVTKSDLSNKPSVSRGQHLVPGSLVLLLASVVAWLSFTAEPAAAFVFPRVIAVVFLVLALWNFIRCALGLSRVGSGFMATELKNIAPGVVLAGLLVYVAARLFGFYVASFVVFLLVYAAYDPASHLVLRSWIKRIAVTFGFMAIIYGLFALLLQVQTPRGLFF